jgi:hypothetical protein
MNRAGSRVGVRRWSGIRFERAAAPGHACPPLTSLTSPTPASDANPTSRLPSLDAGGSSREQQEAKGRKR